MEAEGHGIGCTRLPAGLVPVAIPANCGQSRTVWSRPAATTDRGRGLESLSGTPDQRPFDLSTSAFVPMDLPTAVAPPPDIEPAKDVRGIGGLIAEYVLDPQHDGRISMAQTGPPRLAKGAGEGTL